MNIDLNKPEIVHSETFLELHRIKEHVSQAKIELLYKNLPYGIFGSLTSATVLFFTLAYLGHSQYIKSWFIAMCTLTVLRFASLLYYKLSPQLQKSHFLVFILGTTASAITWGLLGSLLMPSDHIAEVIITIAIIGVSASASQSLQANLIINLIYSTAAILPLVIWCFIQGKVGYTTLGLTILIYLFYISLFSYRASNTMNELLKLQFEIKTITERSIESNKNLRLANQQLRSHEIEMDILNNLSKNLLDYSNGDQLYIELELAANKLFQNINGGLYIASDNNTLKLVASWGPDKTLLPNISMQTCFCALYKNEYISNTQNPDTLCSHYISKPLGNYICIPIILHSEILGILNFTIPKDRIISNFTTHKIYTFSDIIKKTLNNLHKHEILESEASHDPLTNLFNRRYLNIIIPKEIKRTIRDKTTFCFVMIDIDNFKKINDQYGHEIGDQALKSISAIFNMHLRESDIACRYGGDEFALIAINSKIELFLPRLEVIRQEISQISLNVGNDIIKPLSVSMGVAEAPRQGRTTNELIQAADKALYAAKIAGRNRIVIAPFNDLSPTIR